MYSQGLSVLSKRDNLRSSNAFISFYRIIFIINSSWTFRQEELLNHLLLQQHCILISDFFLEITVQTVILRTSEHGLIEGAESSGKDVHFFRVRSWQPFGCRFQPWEASCSSQTGWTCVCWFVFYSERVAPRNILKDQNEFICQDAFENFILLFLLPVLKHSQLLPVCFLILFVLLLILRCEKQFDQVYLS